jgi:hypothetical protein
LQSKFFPAKFFFCILDKGVLAGKNLLCKEGYSIQKIGDILGVSLFPQTLGFVIKAPNSHELQK